MTDGYIHNSLRMLWGKKILEWSRDGETAMDIMIHLNDKFALDGRDPNSYTPTAIGDTDRDLARFNHQVVRTSDCKFGDFGATIHDEYLACPCFTAVLQSHNAQYPVRSLQCTHRSITHSWN